jgi:hypothetical protein
METPIFIFSLPRSGSTLLQRILMSHKDISSLAEPWILLPQMYLLKPEGSFSEYSSLTAYKGIDDFIKNLPNKEEDYFELLRKFMLNLYAKQCRNNERFFLDKTPRYYLIIDEIVKLFPKAKFIFLFRNPVHVYASIINTWGKGRLNKFHGNYHDISIGFNLISDGYRKHKERSIAINYENLIEAPEIELSKISKYLDLKISDNVLQEFSSQETKGILGDPSGVKKYKKISNEGLFKWRSTINSIYRKKTTIRLLSDISEEAFKTQGYNKQEIFLEIRKLNNKKNHLFFLDVFDVFVSYLIRKTNIHLYKSENFSWIKKK